MPVEQDGTGQGQDDFLALIADLDVGGAGDHDLRLRGAILDVAELEPIGVGVLGNRQNLADDDLVALPDRPGLSRHGMVRLRGRLHAKDAHAGHLEPRQGVKRLD